MSATDTGELRVKIRNMCAYINHNGAIAAYLGCSSALVASIRAKMPAKTIGGRKLAASPPAEPVRGLVDPYAKQAEEGSRRLLRAYVAYFRRHHPHSDLARVAA